tara:strand:- start:1120 stop:1521 length:402 start_codon:yes stop_codon:yes gene_type:complete
MNKGYAPGRRPSSGKKNNRRYKFSKQAFSKDAGVSASAFATSSNYFLRLRLLPFRLRFCPKTDLLILDKVPFSKRLIFASNLYTILFKVLRSRNMSLSLSVSGGGSARPLFAIFSGSKGGGLNLSYSSSTIPI